MSHADKGCATGSIYTGGVRGKIPHNFFSPTLVLKMDTMEPQSLNINTTLNEEGNGAILHTNCQSDGKMERWERFREASNGQKQEWLVKLGALLKLHGKINCQWQDHQVEPNTNVSRSSDVFSHPWAYRIVDFPSGYKLFVVERKAKGDDPPRKDCYLCGMFFLPLFCAMLLTISFQVDIKSTDPLKNSFPTCFGCSTKLKGSMENASANTAATTTRHKSTKYFHYHLEKNIPKGPEGPRNTRKQEDHRAPGVSHTRGFWSKTEIPSQPAQQPPWNTRCVDRGPLAMG